MRTRKTILLSAIGLLACALALQTVLSRPAAIKLLKTAEKPDSIVVEKADGTKLTLYKDGGNWTVGEEKYPADQAEAGNLADAVETVKQLDVVSRGGDDARYGFGDGERMTVTAKKGGKVLRTITVGKAAATGQQTYARLDGAPENVLVSGNFKRLFGKAADDLRDKKIFGFKTADIAAVGVSGDKNYRIAKSGNAGEWSVAAPKEKLSLKLDKAKVEAWLSSVGTLKAEGFAPADAKPSGKPFGELSLDLGTRTATVTVLEETKDGKFVCSSSESPYLFILSEYAVKRFDKPLEELAAE